MSNKRLKTGNEKALATLNMTATYGNDMDCRHETWVRMRRGTPTCDHLKALYPHKRDNDCFLQEDTHTYYVHGQKYKYSVSSVWKVFFPEFDESHADRMIVKATNSGPVNLEVSLYWLYMHFTMLDRIDPGSAAFWKKTETTLRVAKDHCASLRTGSFEIATCHKVMRDFVQGVQPKKPKGPSCYFLPYCAGYSAAAIREVWQLNGQLESLKGTILHKQAELFIQEFALWQLEQGRQQVSMGEALHAGDVLHRARKAATPSAAMIAIACHVSPDTWDHPTTQQYFRQLLSVENSVEYRKLEEWLCSHSNLSPYRTEWSIYDEEAMIAGQIDALFFDVTRPGSIIMVDWKRARQILSGDMEIQKTQAFGEYGLHTCEFAPNHPGPCRDMLDCSYNHYLVQQHLYAHILRLRYAVYVDRLLLVQCHPNVGKQAEAFHEADLEQHSSLAHEAIHAFLNGWWNHLASAKDSVAQMQVSPDSGTISGRAMRASVALAQLPGVAILAVPASRVTQSPMHGLAVKVDGEEHGQHHLVPAQRVLFLVQGTSKSTLDRMGGNSDHAFCVASLNAKCLLDEGQETRVDLKGYCNMDTMLDFRIDHEPAVVTVSSIAIEDDRLVASIEFIRKVEPHALSVCQKALTIEWKAALTNAVTNDLESYSSPARPEYWSPPPDQPAPKVQQVDSDAKSPCRMAGA
jgi:hypothetical protein